MFPHSVELTIGMAIVSPTSSHVKEQHQAEATAVTRQLKVVAEKMALVLVTTTSRQWRRMLVETLAFNDDAV